MKRFRKAAIGVLASFTATLGLLPLVAAPASGAANFKVTAFAGADRYDTAAKMSTAVFGTADNVIIATGENFPDALAGNYLAGIQNGPILLTAKDSVPAVTKTALTSLKTKNVTLLGGVAAISQAVENDLKATASSSAAGGNLNVTRVAGATRYDTAQAVNTTTPAAGVGSVGGKKTAFIATGQNFPDALFAGTIAWDLNFPMILTTPGTLAPQAKSTLQSLGIQQVMILGGTVAVSQAVEAEINGMGITTLQRFAGADRIDTNVKLNNYAVSSLPGVKLTKFFVATADNFPDALTAGPAAGRTDYTLIWAISNKQLPPAVKTGIETHNKPTATDGFVAGGDAVCDQACRDAITVAGGGTPAPPTGTGATGRPELVAATVVSVTPPTGVEPGTVIRYTFDEALTGGIVAPAGFHVYNAAGLAAGAPSSAVVDSSDTKSALVRYASITSQGAAGALTVATADEGTVGGNTTTDLNPEGDAPLNQSGSTQLPAGITAAPDLQTVGNFRAGSAATTPDTSARTLVDFTFDEAAFTVGPDTNFNLLSTDGINLTNCDALDNQAGGNGATGVTTITVACGAVTTLQGSQFSRGIVLANTVSDEAAFSATSAENPLQTADISNNGNTDTPDLVSAEFRKDVKATVAAVPNTDVDQVLFTFDEPVVLTGTAGGNGSGFGVYSAAGNNVNTARAEVLGNALAGGPAPERSTVNDTQVLVTYPNGTLDAATGVNVTADAVKEATGTNRSNQDDEVGVANTATTTSGTTNGPDLTSVTITAITDSFGQVTGYRATYAFDEDVDPLIGGEQGLFKLWLNDVNSTELDCSGTLGTTFAHPTAEDQDHLVICSAFTVSGGGAATPSQIQSAVLGTVDNGAVQEEGVGTQTNPEGASAAVKA